MKRAEDDENNKLVLISKPNLFVLGMHFENNPESNNKFSIGPRNFGTSGLSGLPAFEPSRPAQAYFPALATLLATFQTDLAVWIVLLTTFQAERVRLSGLTF